MQKKDSSALKSGVPDERKTDTNPQQSGVRKRLIFIRPEPLPV
jgi:hypothetical protein